jgi:hypothetical protein
MNSKKDLKTKEAEVKKQNQDFPNVPASTEKIHSEETLKKEIKKTSALHPNGKTDNTDQQKEN